MVRPLKSNFSVLIPGYPGSFLTRQPRKARHQNVPALRTSIGCGSGEQEKGEEQERGVGAGDSGEGAGEQGLPLGETPIAPPPASKCRAGAGEAAGRGAWERARQGKE